MGKGSIAIHGIVVIFLIVMLLVLSVAAFMWWGVINKNQIASLGCYNNKFDFCVSWKKQPGEFNSDPPTVEPDIFTSECTQPTPWECEELLNPT